MDELAAKLGIDPVDLRLRNYTERDMNDDRPFSSKELRACYRQAGERFGWSRRDPRPRSMRDGSALIGWGMAGGVWEATQMPASAKAVLSADGTLTVSSATEDIGTRSNRSHCQPMHATPPPVGPRLRAKASANGRATPGFSVHTPVAGEDETAADRSPP